MLPGIYYYRTGCMLVPSTFSSLDSQSLPLNKINVPEPSQYPSRQDHYYDGNHSQLHLMAISIL